jgi:DNA-binding HxlR family transcriptional regulator
MTLHTFGYSSHHKGSMAKITSFRDRALQSRDAIELLSNKWRITILHLLRNEPLRTSELRGAITEISPKVLTQTLRGLERDGLVERKVHTAVPPRVEYSLTSMGASLLKPLEDLCHWAQAHVQERDQARAQFDIQEPPRKRATRQAQLR